MPLWPYFLINEALSLNVTRRGRAQRTNVFNNIAQQPPDKHHTPTDVRLYNNSVEIVENYKTII